MNVLVETRIEGKNVKTASGYLAHVRWITLDLRARQLHAIYCRTMPGEPVWCDLEEVERDAWRDVACAE